MMFRFHSVFFLSLVVLAWWPASAHAQIVNVQDLFISQTEEGLNLGAVGKTELKSGNTDFQYYNLALVGRYLSGRHTLLGTGNLEYAEKSQDKFTNRHFEHLRYRFEALPPAGVEAFVQHEFNEFRRMNLRLLLGVGPTWKALSTRRFHLFVGSVYMFEYDELGTGEYDDSGALWKTHRWNNYLTFQWNVREGVKILTTVYYQPAFTDFSNYNLLLSANLSVVVNDWLSVVITYNYSRQSVPPQGVNPYDSVLVAGLAIKAGPFLR